MTAIDDLVQRGLKVPEGFRELPAPPRAWALAKAAYETAQEASFAEQRRVIAEITADDPEPPEPKCTRMDHTEWTAWHEVWKAWNERNSPRWDGPIEGVIFKHKIHEYETLYKAAESVLVEYAEDRIKTHYGERYAAVKGAFDAYRENRLYGDMREKFLKICFNTPETT